MLDRERYRYQEFISDIAGQDIAAYNDDSAQALKAVRDWLAASHASTIPSPGRAVIAKRHRRFMAELPAICAATGREVNELTFTEFADAASTWLQRELGG